MIIGCIADDFTGASDAASFLVKGGMRTLLLSDDVSKWDSIDLSEADAVVIALKTRTVEKEKAIAISLQAISWLQQHGAKQFYFKYCSTFDSTPEGNIGPVADAIMEYLSVDHAILCPALPANGRTVKNGNLFVNGIPLDESSMKDHPLTPMWDHSIKKLIEPQSRYQAFLSADKLEKQDRYYLVPDYENDQDAERIIEQFGQDLFLTGGSGILEFLARSHVRSEGDKTTHERVFGKTLLLAGSCSVATRRQIKQYQESGYPFYKIDPFRITWGKEREAGTILSGPEITEQVLIYSSDTPDQVRKSQEIGVADVAGAIEDYLAGCAQKALEMGYTKIIVAGGETSGAVTKALGFTNFRIGDSIAPGVPVLIPLESPGIRLVLKSGNFGEEDFFLKAMQIIG